MNRDRIPSPKNGSRSCVVQIITAGLNRFMRETERAVSNWGSIQPILCTAGMTPINIAESVRFDTKSGNTVTSDANPKPKPKKAPSSRLTVKLNFRFLFNSEWMDIGHFQA
jgi:hypothetical protein